MSEKYRTSVEFCDLGNANKSRILRRKVVILNFNLAFGISSFLSFDFPHLNVLLLTSKLNNTLVTRNVGDVFLTREYLSNSAFLMIYN